MDTLRRRSRGRRSRSPRSPSTCRAPARRPSVATLLAVDAAYREGDRRDELPRFAPRRRNPSGEAWLPVLHTERNGWKLTALYSNTRRAHERDRVGDWVIVTYRDGGNAGQSTVVTEWRGPLEGKRVVRGRETESLLYHDFGAGRDEGTANREEAAVRPEPAAPAR